MLEFQKGFFEPEIRDGFYVDVLMKSFWAAELEVLHRVAEICSRYHIRWYAAYGTLLGAIRHSGFVPWDDDVDIWVKRKDYNRLMRILPTELPVGYLVRSPLTVEGYGQFQTLVINSDHIHTDGEWLEQYHGCPFMAGVDIFPLDRLPHLEEDRVIQRAWVSIALRGAQVAGYMQDEIYQYAENPMEQRDTYLEEIREAFNYLVENCGAKIEERLLNEGKWIELSNLFAKWANYIAMIYEEEGGSDLVNFVDYVRWPSKKYPEEWFEKVDSAAFENFMIPVPGEYHKVLCRHYKKYMVKKRNTMQHDYPLYARQLEEAWVQLREYCQLEGNSIEDGVMPCSWKDMLTGQGGMRKKILLYTHDVSVYIADGQEALRRLELELQIFYEAREWILLWWKPQREMANALYLTSPELAERYKEIRERYRASGWGVCDESYDRQRTLDICDAYYGEKSYLAEEMRNRGKGVMIAAESTISDLEVYINSLIAKVGLHLTGEG